MAENKTVKTGASVDEFMAGVENKRRREDGLVLLEIWACPAGDNEGRERA